MIPFKDDNPTRSFPVITLLIIIANALVFLYQESLPSGGARGLGLQEMFVARFAAIPAYILREENTVAIGRYLVKDVPMLSPSWLTIFTSMFMHGSWMHIIGNMLYLWIFGNNIEDLMGKLRFLVFYLICGVAAAGLQILMSTSATSQYIPMVGASGAIAGVLGGYLIKYPGARVRTLVIFIFIQVVALPAWIVLGLWFVMQFFSAIGGALTPAASGGGVAFFAHVGGFIAGMMLVGIFAFGRKTSRHFRQREVYEDDDYDDYRRRGW